MTGAELIARLGAGQMDAYGTVGKKVGPGLSYRIPSFLTRHVSVICEWDGEVHRACVALDESLSDETESAVRAWLAAHLDAATKKEA